MAPAPKRSLAVLAAILLAQLALHAALSNAFFVNDEGHFMAYSWLTAKGEVVYRDYFESHPPLTEFIAAPLALFFPPSPALFRLLSTAAMLATTVIIFITARKIYGDGAAIFSAAAFAFTEPIFFGFWFVAEPFIALALAASASLAVHSLAKKDARLELAAAGIAAGAAFLLKPQAIIFIAATSAALYLSCRRPALPLTFIAGALAAFISACAYFALNGALSGFLYYAYAFSVLEANSGFMQLFPSNYYVTTIIAALAAALACSASLLLIARSPKPGVKFVLLAWLASSLAFAFPRLDAFHLVPALPVFAVILWREKAGPAHRGALVALALVGILAFASLFQYAGQPDKGILCDQKAAAYISSRTAPGEEIFVAPFTPQIYAYADRGHASRYLTLGPWFMTPQIEAEVIRELEEGRPRYIYYFNGMFEEGKTMREYAPAIYGYIYANYNEEAVFPECASYVLARR